MPRWGLIADRLRRSLLQRAWGKAAVGDTENGGLGFLPEGFQSFMGDRRKHSRIPGQTRALVVDPFSTRWPQCWQIPGGGPCMLGA